MTPISLDISIVTYKTDLLGLKIALISLCQAIERARERMSGQLLVSLFIVENAPRHPTPAPSRLAASRYLRAFDAIHHVESPTNVGFGRGHNLAIFDKRGATADYHLVLNPDVELDPDALRLCIEYLEANPEAVAVVPKRAEGKKCGRSWRITADVGSDPAYPELSARDAAAIREIEKQQTS